MSGFFTLHRDLSREGPGEAADVHWALGQVGVPLRVADLACGPGADLVTLAEALPGAQIDGLDRQAHFVAAARALVARFGDRVTVRQGDMAVPGGPYDLIWCAGAVYFPGIAVALGLWHSALAPGGHSGFSEPVLLGQPASATVRRFWQGEADVTGQEWIAARVEAAGFRTIGTRVIVGAAWAACYEPMTRRIEALRAGADAQLASALDEAAREIALWRHTPDEIAYLLSVVTPR